MRAWTVRFFRIVRLWYGLGADNLKYTWNYNPLLGYAQLAILAKAAAEFLLRKDAAHLEHVKRGVLASRVGTRKTVRTTVEGQTDYYDLTVEPLREATGRVVGVTGAPRDNTARRQLLQTLREPTHELNERLKALDCLYGICRPRERPGMTLEDVLQATVELIRQAWQRPEVTAARITFHGREYCTGITIHGRHCGIVEVCYLEDRPESAEGPCLKEERKLRHAIAGRLARINERRRTEEQHRTNSRTAVDSFWPFDIEGHIRLTRPQSSAPPALGSRRGHTPGCEQV
jgi:hypothetical protein